MKKFLINKNSKTMKKLHSMMMMLAIMVTALGFAACSDDDDDNNGKGKSGDYIEITLNGKTYKEYLLGIYGNGSIAEDSEGRPISLTNTTEDVFEKYGFSFFMGITHYSRKNELLASKPGTYYCLEDLDVYDYDNYKIFVFWPSLMIDYNDYDWVSGTHKVTSIKEVNGEVQVEGNFTGEFEFEGESCNVKGSYRITIP